MHQCLHSTSWGLSLNASFFRRASCCRASHFPPLAMCFFFLRVVFSSSFVLSRVILSAFGDVFFLLARRFFVEFVCRASYFPPLAMCFFFLRPHRSVESRAPVFIPFPYLLSSLPLGHFLAWQCTILPQLQSTMLYFITSNAPLHIYLVYYSKPPSTSHGL